MDIIKKINSLKTEANAHVVNEILKALERTVIVEEEVFAEMVEDQYFLSCLESCGVDNWEGYDDACRIYEKEFPDEE